MNNLFHKRVVIESGDLVIETVTEIGPLTHTNRFLIGLSPEQARDLFMDLDEHFGLLSGAPKLIPRDVFEALPFAKKHDLMKRGFQLYDEPEDLEPDALVYDIRLKQT